MDETELQKIFESIAECDNEILDEMQILQEEVKNCEDLHNNTMIRLTKKSESADQEFADSMQTHLNEYLVNIKIYSLWLEKIGSRIDPNVLSDSLLEDIRKQNEAAMASLREKEKEIEEFLASRKKEATENRQKYV